MKRKLYKIIASIVCFTLFLTGVSCKEEEIEQAPQIVVVEGEYLYQNGISEYSILIRDDANYYESFAASELALNLQNATGNSIPVVTESQLKQKTRVISLGHTSLWDEKVGVTLSEKEIRFFIDEQLSNSTYCTTY